MSERELVHAALQWSAAHARRLAVGTEKRRLDKLLKSEGLSIFSSAYTQQSKASRQLTELKRKELATLRVLAKVCAKQRGHLQAAEVIDVDGAVVLLVGAE